MSLRGLQLAIALSIPAAGVMYNTAANVKHLEINLKMSQIIYEEEYGTLRNIEKRENTIETLKIPFSLIGRLSVVKNLYPPI